MIGGSLRIQEVPLLFYFISWTIFFLSNTFVVPCVTFTTLCLCVFPLPTHTHKDVHFPGSCNHLILTAAELTDFIIKHNISVIILPKHDSSSVWRCSPSFLLPLPSSFSPLIPLSPPLSLRVTAHWKTNILALHLLHPPGPSINHASLYSPLLSLHPLLPLSLDCNRILPAAYSLHAFINVSHWDKLWGGKKKAKQNMKLAATGVLRCCHWCDWKWRCPGEKVCLESVAWIPCWA